MQKLNTALLVIVVGLLVGLWLRPQPGRYQFPSKSEPYMFDTATGRFVMLRVSDEVKGHMKAKKETEERVAREAREKWLKENCPSILAKNPLPEVANESLAALFERAGYEQERRECEEWQRAKATTNGPMKTEPPKR